MSCDRCLSNQRDFGKNIKQAVSSCQFMGTCWWIKIKIGGLKTLFLLKKFKQNNLDKRLK